MTVAIQPRTAGVVGLTEENHSLRAEVAELRDDNRHLASTAAQAGTAAADARSLSQRYAARIAAVNNYIATVDESTPWETVRRDVAALSYGEHEPGRDQD